MPNVNMTVDEAGGILDAVDRGEIEVGAALVRHLNLIVEPEEFRYTISLRLTLDQMDELNLAMRTVPPSCMGLIELKRAISNHAHARGELEMGP